MLQRDKIRGVYGPPAGEMVQETCGGGAGEREVKKKRQANRRGSSGTLLGSVDEKDTRYKRGHKNFRIKKNLRCANCSPQVWEALTKKIP